MPLIFAVQLYYARRVKGAAWPKGWLISTVSRWSCITRGPCWPLWGLLSCPFLPVSSPVLLPRRGMKCACYTAGLPGQIIRGKHFRLLFLKVTVILHQAGGRENFFLHFLCHPGKLCIPLYALFLLRARREKFVVKW